jgi:probable HAF family extracellular repeat protein
VPALALAHAEEFRMSTAAPRRLIALALVVVTGAATVAAAPPATAQPATAQPARRPTVAGVPLPMTVAVDVNDRNEIVGLDEAGGVRWRDGVVTRLGTLGGDFSVPDDINNRGQIVGRSATASGDEHAFLWYRGAMTDLGTLGGSTSRASAINDRGDIVGVSTTADGSVAYFRWRRGVMTRIPVPGPVASILLQPVVNERGDVAGTYQLPAEPPVSSLSRVWVWDGRRVTDLGAVGGIDAFLSGLNDRGQVLCTVIDEDGFGHVVLVDRGRRIRVGPASVAPLLGSSALNDRGQVGFTGPAPGTGADRAYLWTRGHVIDLGTLGGSQAGLADLNDRGEATGTSNADTGNRGFVWRRGTLIQLEPLGADLNSQASHINERGLVIGLSVGDFEVRAVAWFTRR